MSLYSDYINANFDPEDYEEPENRCEQCGSFIRKTPEVRRVPSPPIEAEIVEISCKRCGKTSYFDQWAVTPWGMIDFDYLRDSNGDWIKDLAEIERIVKARNPLKWAKDSVGSGAEPKRESVCV